MKKSTKKSILISTSIFALCASLFAAFGSNFDLNTIMRAKAGEQHEGRIITFSGSTVSGTTSTSTAHTESGGTIICKVTNNDSSISSSYVAAMKAGTIIKFYESDGVTEFTFEDLEYISFYKGSSSFAPILNAVYVEGDTFSNTYGSSTTNPRKLNFHSDKFDRDVSVLEAGCNNGTGIVTMVSSIEIKYNCTDKAQTGVSVSTSPTKLSYTEGESFDPAGMIVKAVYSNGSQVATSAYTYSPSGVLTSDVDRITVSHLGFSTTIPITVSAPTVPGTFKYGSYTPYYLLYLYNDGTGLYSYDSNSRTFTWVYSNRRVTLTKTDSGSTFTGDIFFDSSEVTSPTVTVDSGSVKTIRLYVSLGSTSTLRTFTRQ